jgi:hypothetical protein
MFSTAKYLFGRWLRDTAHYFRTGESTIYGEGGHRVFLHPSGYSRVDSYDLWQSEGAKKALEWASQTHKPQTTPQPTMDTDQDKNLKAICEYLKNNPNRLMELLEEIPIPRKMESFPMKELHQEYFKYDYKIYRRESKGMGHQWSLYSEDLMHPDPDCKWYWQDVGFHLARELEGRYLIDCEGYTLDTSDTYIESDNECTYTPEGR